MRHFRSVVLLSALLCLPKLTLADTVFDVTGNLGSVGGPLVTLGTIDINTTTGSVVSWDLVAPSFGGVTGFTFTPADSTFCTPPSCFGGDLGWFTPNTSHVTYLNFYLFPPNPPFTLVGFNGISETGGPDAGYVTTPNSYALYNLNITAATPEPSTLVLIGSGLAGIVGFRRKQLGIDRTKR